MTKSLNAVNKATPLPPEFVSSLVKTSGISSSSEINLVGLPASHPAYRDYVIKLRQYLPEIVKTQFQGEHRLKTCIYFLQPLISFIFLIQPFLYGLLSSIVRLPFMLHI